MAFSLCIGQRPIHPSSFRLHPFGPDQASRNYTVMAALGVEQEYDTFLQESVALFQSRIPTPEQLQQRLRIEVHGALLLDPAEIEALLLEQEQRAQERTLAAEVAALERERLAETFRTMASPWAEVVDAFQARLYDEALDCLAVINRREHIPGTTMRRIANLRALYDVMALTQEGPLDQAIRAIEGATQPRSLAMQQAALDGLKYDVALVTDALLRLVNVTRESKERIGRMKDEG
jgi:hypothetical protein